MCFGVNKSMMMMIVILWALSRRFPVSLLPSNPDERLFGLVGSERQESEELVHSGGQVVVCCVIVCWEMLRAVGDWKCVVSCLVRDWTFELSLVWSTWRRFNHGLCLTASLDQQCKRQGNRERLITLSIHDSMSVWVDRIITSWSKMVGNSAAAALFY